MSLPKWMEKIRKDYAVSEQLPLNEFRQMVEALTIAVEALTKMAEPDYDGDVDAFIYLSKDALARIEALGK